MTPVPPIYLYTDYGVQGPYVGLLHAAVRRAGCAGEIVDLQHDAPTFEPGAAGLLLKALLAYLPADILVVAVVDPGVGGDREGLVMRLPKMTLVGPDNGLFAPLLAEALQVERIQWQPDERSASFDGRDWFVPVAARLAMGRAVDLLPVEPRACVGYGVSLAHSKIIYVDGFGNLMTGVEASQAGDSSKIRVGPHVLPRARTFSDVPAGEALWYVNSLGLVEVAVNQGSAADKLGLSPGTPLTFLN